MSKRAIVVLMDSLNRHFLEVYGNEWVKTPNITRLAEHSVVFTNHWLGSAPCMPARRDMLTGRLSFPWRSWGPIEPFEKALPRELRRQQGVFSHIVTDHHHYFETGGENYVTAFDTWQFLRGQEHDPWVSRVKKPALPADYYGTLSSQYELNRSQFRHESDYTGPKTFKAACDWIEANQDADNFLLWVEAFDPHEPFDCPQEYLDLYGDNYRGPHFNWSSYSKVTEPPEAIEHLRKAYAALLTMMDGWLGKLLDTLHQTNLFDDTLIVFTTDHGHLLGEHGFTGKNFTPAYNELAHLPLIVHLPGNKHAGRKAHALTQNVDLMPTLLEFFECKVAWDMHGVSWWPILAGAESPMRRVALYGWYGQSFNITDGHYTYFRAPASSENTPLYMYTSMLQTLGAQWGEEIAPCIEVGRFLPYTEVPVYRFPARNLGDYPSVHVGKYSPYNNENLVFDIKNDYNQLCPISDSELEEKLCRLLIDAMQRIQVPQEQYERLALCR